MEIHWTPTQTPTMVEDSLETDPYVPMTIALDHVLMGSEPPWVVSMRSPGAMAELTFNRESNELYEISVVSAESLDRRGGDVVNLASQAEMGTVTLQATSSERFIIVEGLRLIGVGTMTALVWGSDELQGLDWRPISPRVWAGTTHGDLVGALLIDHTVQDG